MSQKAEGIRKLNRPAVKLAELALYHFLSSPTVNGANPDMTHATSLQVSLQRVDIPGGPERTVIQVNMGERCVHVVVRGDTTEVRGVGSQAGGGSRWASAGLLATVGKQEVDTLLSQVMLE